MAVILPVAKPGSWANGLCSEGVKRVIAKMCNLSCLHNISGIVNFSQHERDSTVAAKCC